MESTSEARLIDSKITGEKTSSLSEQNWLERLRGRFVDFVNRELRGSLPELDINIFYSRHVVGEDIKDLGRAFSECDLFIPETFKWHPASLQQFRELAAGEISPEQAASEGKFSFPSHDWAQNRLIYNSNKPIAIIDVPWDHPIVARAEEVKKNKQSAHDNLGKFDFMDSITAHKKALEMRALVETDREEYMVANLGEAVKDAVKNYSQLRGKRRLKVLIEMGSFHTTVFRSLKNLGHMTTKEFSDSPVVYDLQDEVLRRYRFKRQVDDTLIARMIFGELVWEILYLFNKKRRLMLKKPATDKKLTIFVRAAASRFNFDEIKNLYDQLRTLSLRQRRALLEEELNKKGIRIPRTEEEFDPLVVRHPIFDHAGEK
ncbi:hypothetical protein A2165_00685 [Candidatus Curtissbacteria bacterium RBG_13_40_7]|uniref:Uncharacterized protein n=1 Tax=Candidatus Curtissbacteria bacterium RBG_13_40_7 TaxID=1797706 RepID=A0A1F5FUE2_9BACT|nr:MAG: hypothetical protein A2165_00685 [Candidatus Curtissbacteria bacterium RBG_13_40_7]